MSEATNQCIKETLREQGNVLSPHVVAQCIDDLQADNAALREQVKRLSTCGTDHSTPWWQVKCEDLEAQLATLQAQLADEQQRADRAVKDRSEELDVKTKGGLSCSEWLMRTAIAERKAKDLKAQLRQVEGERDHAKKMEAVQKEVADNQTWHVQKLKDWRDTVTLALQRPGGARFEDVPEHIKGLVREHATLRQLVEALPVLDMRFDSVAVGPLGWTVGGVTFGRVTEANAYSALLQYRATLAAPSPTEERHE